MAPIRILLVLFGAALALARPGHATDDPATLCLDATAAAARATGVPHDILLAISLVETGRNARPWPWTVNVGGDGQWLDSAGAAEALITDRLAAGLTNIDVGCFQLNHRWHGAAFASVADMLDPYRNAIYAAGFLADHFQRTGDWASAAAAYHSATPEHAERYRARFEATLASLGGDRALPGAPPPDRTNGFPLLVAGAAGARGSLVPAAPGGQRLIGMP